MVQVVVDILVVVKLLLLVTLIILVPVMEVFPSSEYYVYILGASGGEGNGGQGNFRSLGGQSYINPVATAYSDLGFHGPLVGSNSNSDQTGGQVELQFTF